MSPGAQPASIDRPQAAFACRAAELERWFERRCCRTLVLGVLDAALVMRLRAAGHVLTVRETCTAQSAGAGDPDARFDRLLVLPGAAAFDALALLERADDLLAATGPVQLRLDRRCVLWPGGDAAISGLAQRFGWLMPAAQTSQTSQAADPAEHPWPWLDFERHLRPPARLVAVQAARSPSMRRLFERVFERPLSADEWEWKYGEGRGHAVGLCRDGELVGHTGVMTRVVCMDGRQILAAQVGDVMVLPAANQGLGRQGALQRITATLLEQQIGLGARHLIGFGFPNERHMRLAAHLHLYGGVDRMVQLDWQGAPPTTWRERILSLREVDLPNLEEGSADWKALHQLWEAMAASLPRAILPQRAPDRIRYRYGRRPGVRYRLWLLRSPLTRPLGAFVLRLHEQHAELMDLIGPAGRAPALVRAARRMAVAAGLPRLQTWVSASHVECLDDPADRAARSDPGVIVPTSVHTPGPSVQSLTGRWFLLSGDTDFL